MARLFWFRRDLRLQDNPALNAAIEGAIADGDPQVVAAYLVDLNDFEKLSGIRQHSLVASLDALGASIHRLLTIRHHRADFVAELLELASVNGVTEVHATEAFDPVGMAEQKLALTALTAAGINLHLHDSYYAVRPGSVLKPDGTSYRVYTPFYRGWVQVGWERPFSLPPKESFRWKFTNEQCDGRPATTKPAPFEVKAGEAFALRTFARFKERALNEYDELRNRADLSGTSHLSHALAFGEIHPRTLLAELSDSPAHTVYAKELAWREFYAEVLWRNPHTLDDYYEPKFARMRYEEPGEKFEAWKQGKTGFPMVDAGMRQLLATGWMHNRVRMIVASFLVKDLHIEWQHGAAWFEENLSDFDPASNSHGWQWTAGCGTDASPYYRIFNPILQGYKFDPDGNYVRKYIPELEHIEGAEVHEPWNRLDGYTAGYAAPIVDHAAERDESLARLEEIKA